MVSVHETTSSSSTSYWMELEKKNYSTEFEFGAYLMIKLTWYTAEVYQKGTNK